MAELTMNHAEPTPPSLGKGMVERMTNWQRSQWAKAGYPGLSRGNYDADKIRPFWLRVRPS